MTSFFILMIFGALFSINGRNVDNQNMNRLKTTRNRIIYKRHFSNAIEIFPMIFRIKNSTITTKIAMY